MSGWVTVPAYEGRGRREEQGGGRCELVGRAKNAGATNTKHFLTTFKTELCQNKDFHDYRKCPYYHPPGNDRRRDPYTTFYLPDDDILSQQELSFHPTRYLTELCTTPHCRYGKFCCMAHDKESLRDRAKAMEEYLGHEREVQISARSKRLAAIGGRLLPESSASEVASFLLQRFKQKLGTTSPGVNR